MKTHGISKLFQIASEQLSVEERAVVAGFCDVLRSEPDQTAAAFMRVRIEIARYPAPLKKVHDWLARLMVAGEAKKTLQTALGQLSPLFSGSSGGIPEEFFAALREKKAPAKAKKSAVADLAQARRLSDQVAAASNNRSDRNAVMAELGDPKKVNTATLHAVANMIFKDSHTYRGRKTALSRIDSWIETGEQIRSTDRALERVGV